MLCWGSWANTQKLASKEWRFQLFYWDYAIGVLFITLLIAFTLGSFGSAGRAFTEDVFQANGSSIGLALLGGIVFNLANILIVAAIDVAGMAVAFPVGIGLALGVGVVTNYLAAPIGNPVLLFLGVAGVVIAIIMDAIAYRKLPHQAQNTPLKGIAISIVGGLLMGFFYRFVAASMSADFINPSPGKLTPYTAVVIFSFGLFLSNFIWNGIMMAKPFTGSAVSYVDYFKNGNIKLHSLGLLGGVIWGIGMTFSIIASGVAGFAISYGLGQGATMIAALWGVFVWKEFKDAPQGTNKLLGLMFVSFIIGLLLIICARII